ncbi:hypothetical protein AB0F81_40860, partial [Actinoplanes sp. NPDC024001]
EAVARAVEQARRAAEKARQGAEEARQGAEAARQGAGAAAGPTTSRDRAPSSPSTPDDGGTSGSAARARSGPGSDVWAMATAEAAVGDAAAHRSVDHDLGASAPEDRDAAAGDDARSGDAV